MTRKTKLSFRFALLAGVLFASGASAQESGTTEPGQPSALPSPAAITLPPRMLGLADAPVTVDVYTSFVCATCAAWHVEILPALVRDLADTGQIKIIYHDVITNPPEHSARAAAIGLCAAPGRFFDVADSFMSGLAAAASEGGNVAAWYGRAVAASGLTEAEIQACASSEATHLQLVAQNDIAESLGIQTLPMVQVNGQFVAEPTEQAVRAAVLFAPPASEATETVAAPQPANAS